MSNELLDKYDTFRRDKRLLPVKCSSFYENKILEEEAQLGHKDGPLNRIIYPSQEKIDLKPAHEVDDFVEDRKNMPDQEHMDFIHKYSNRILYMPQSHCFAHCMYCFRQDILEEKKGSSNSDMPNKYHRTNSITRLIHYIQSHPEITELILSGGDPLMLPAAELDHIFQMISEQTHIKDFRLHTRALVFSPRSFSDKHIGVLSHYQVRLVHHIVHPYELCSVNKQVIDQLNHHGIRSYNHFPLLRKINDHTEVLIRLLSDLDDLHIRNLSIYFPDPVHYSSAYRISFRRLFELVNEFNKTTPSWINATRFCQDTIHGKVRIEDLVHYTPEQGYALFNRQGVPIKVPDHPLEWDEPGELSTILWKG
ncbi:MAG: 4Fe-4S cluster-binding domain-containing protein [Planctomycetes bacterium]|nr:4Fe-4S cluster-binding domain-containing protein [Planctomycetota bacterium]